MRWQSSIRRIASVNIPEERLMWNILLKRYVRGGRCVRDGRRRGFGFGADATVAQLASLAERPVIAERGFERYWPQNDDQTKQQAAAKLSLDLRASRTVRAGLSWLVTCILEGFAVYAESMYPCLVDPAQLNGDATRGDATGGQKLQPHRQSAYDDGVAWQFSANPWLFGEPESRVPQTSRIARFWLGMRRERRATLTGATLESLDERTLRDIGGHYPDIEKIVGYQDPRAR
jgi:uncharacterized protein YjiS (DUF1127 family)